MELNVYISHGTGPYYNLAIEDYLVSDYKNGLTLYLWSNHNTVVIGKHQLAAKECNFALLTQEGGYLARRMSGGGAVYHDVDNLCYTFIYDRRDKANFCDKEAYRIIINALADFGINAKCTGRNDIEVDGRKVSGNAYYTKGNIKVHHGTLLIDTNIEKMQRYLLVDRQKLSGHGVTSVRSRVANLKEFCKDIDKTALTKRIVISAQELLGVEAKYIDEDKGYCEMRKRQLQSDDWLYSFEVYDNTASARFSWGQADVTFSVQKGIITYFELYTDCLDTVKAERVKERLIGLNLYTAKRTGDKMTDDLIALCQQKIF